MTAKKTRKHYDRVYTTWVHRVRVMSQYEYQLRGRRKMGEFGEQVATITEKPKKARTETDEKVKDVPTTVEKLNVNVRRTIQGRVEQELREFGTQFKQKSQADLIELKTVFQTYPRIFE